MVIRNSIYTLAILSIYSMTGARAYADDFIIKKNDFKANVKSIQICPLIDSLQAIQVEKIRTLENGISLEDKDRNDPQLNLLLEKVKHEAKKKYYFAGTVLKLDNAHARDSLIALINEKILYYFVNSSKYNIYQDISRNEDSTTCPKPDAVISPSLILEDVTETRMKGRNYKTELYTCAVALSAWVYDKDNKPLWHKSTEIARIYEDATLEYIFNEEKIDDSIASVFKSLVKLSY